MVSVAILTDIVYVVYRTSSSQNNEFGYAGRVHAIWVARRLWPPQGLAKQCFYMVQSSIFERHSFFKLKFVILGQLKVVKSEVFSMPLRPKHDGTSVQ